MDISTGAIQDFKLITGGFQAEYGEQSTGIAEIITKSGTNEVTFSYAIIGDNPLPFTDYLSTVKIETAGDDACTIDWRGTFQPKGDDEDEEEEDKVGGGERDERRGRQANESRRQHQ